MTPWLKAMRRAQVGGPSAAEDGAASDAVQPIEPMVDVPPVAANADLAQSAKPDFMLSVAREAVRRSGDVAAAPAARATPPSPDPTANAPD